MEITDTRGTIDATHIKKGKHPIPPTEGGHENTDTRGTIDVFHNTPFGIVDVLDAFDLRDRTNLWELFGATVPASPPDTFALLFSALEVLLQRRARPASALPRTLRPSPCHRTCSNISRHDTPFPQCAPTVSSCISVASRRRKRRCAGGLEAAAAEQQKHHKNWVTTASDSETIRKPGLAGIPFRISLQPDEMNRLD